MEHEEEGTTAPPLPDFPPFLIAAGAAVERRGQQHSATLRGKCTAGLKCCTYGHFDFPALALNFRTRQT